MKRSLMTLVLSCALASAVGATDASSTGNSEQRAGSVGESVNPVVQWNRVLLAIVRTPGGQPATVHSTRNFAVMHAAIYDAVNSIERTHRPYLVRLPRERRRASQEAAAAVAAHEVLVALYPAFQSVLDSELEQSLAPIPEGEAKTEGIRIGKRVARRILDLRSDDGSNASPIPYVFGTQPGDYQSTPPNFPPQPVFTHWPFVRPFALERADQFRPGPPPALTSHAYALSFNEVKSLGVVDSPTATEDQALTGRFWGGPIQNYWNEIAQTASVSHQLTTARNARLFALLNLSFGDAAIAFYDGKYAYSFWRPVTAIRVADTAKNPETEPDPNWLPQAGNTPADPSYPGAHAVVSAAGAEVLIAFFDRDHFNFSVTSEVLPGVERSFNSFSAANQEATLSRIFAGVHFSFDETNGQQLGFQIADFVLDNFLTPRHRRDDGDSDNQ